MRRLVADRLSSDTGQTMAEYGVVLTVVGLAVFASCRCSREASALWSPQSRLVS